MKVQKRNDLASKCSMLVPEARSELRTAEQSIRDGNPDEAFKWIAAALIRLDHLSKAFDRPARKGQPRKAGTW